MKPLSGTATEPASKLAGYTGGGLVAPARREAADAVLAKNLTAARVVAGLTQQELAEASGVSRATIAQLETGYSDPRLSTIVDLAAALNVAPMVLLVGTPEAAALGALLAGGGGTGTAATALRVPDVDLAKMREFVASGMLKDRLRAARVGASVARRLNHPSPGVPVTAGVLSATLPGAGTLAGAALGELLSGQAR